MQTLKKFIAAAASAGLISLSATPAFAVSYNVTVSGNGSGSDQDVTYTTTQSTTVTQTNVADVTNDVDVTAETGDNSASGNTGGSGGDHTTINTGDATATSLVDNTLNTNWVDVGCGCLESSTVNISENGSDSDNTVGLTSSNIYGVTQSNFATLVNEVDVTADSGDNNADDNTNGEVSIDTGNVIADSDIINRDINDNWASLGASDLDGTIIIDIIGNGTLSDNDATFLFVNSITASQTNTADVLNDVDVTGESGGNSASDNTGGDVDVNTGNVNVGSLVDSTINFNGVEADCCVFSIDGEISGNGSDSDSTIGYTDSNVLGATQSNFCGDDDANCDTLVVADGDSGDNTTDDNTNGEVDVTTGDSAVDSDVFTETNVNEIEQL